MTTLFIPRHSVCAVALTFAVVLAGCSSTQQVTTREAETADFYPFDEAPALTNFVSPIYPAELKTQGLEGSVYVRVLVGVDGAVKDASVLRSSDSGFEAASLEASRQWKFRPAKHQGEFTPAYVMVPVQFSLSK